MKKLCMIVPLVLVLGLVFCNPMLAKEKAGAATDTPSLSRSVQGSRTNQTLINVGQLAMWIQSNGISAITPGGNSGLFFPRGLANNAAVIFTDGPVWGGFVNDGAEPALRVGGSTYDPGMVPGKILRPGVAEDKNDPQVNRVWKIRRDFLKADLRQDAAEFNEIQNSDVTQSQIDEVRAIYDSDWRDWPANRGAPFYDADGDGQYNPAFNADGSPKLAPRSGEEYDPAKHADEPGLADADQVVWIVGNDLDAPTVQTLYGSPAIGMEIQTTLWAYARSDALGQVIFKQFRFLYKGTATAPPNATIDSLHFCQWSDPDLGTFTDDFAGSDTTLSLGYIYNSSSVDITYAAVGLPPPAAGYDFFAGPLVPDPDGEAIFGLQKRSGWRNLPMTTFGFFAAGGEDSDPTRGGDYNGTLQWWNLLRGFRPRPESPADPWIDPAGNATKFVLTGDPVAGTGWIDTNPGDRRILLAAGPFQMAIGDTQETVVAVMAALGSDRLSSVAVLKFVDKFAQEAFDALFVLPRAPAKPTLTATEFDGEILLNWGDDLAAIASLEGAVDQGYVFEGYVVYQLPGPGAALNDPATIRLATFDAINEQTVISQEVFDQASGLVLDLPVKFGSNSGIERSFRITDDLTRELQLINGQTYFFGVTAYSFNGDQSLKVLESTPTIVTVVPQTTTPGVVYHTALDDTLGNAVGGVNVVHEGPSDGNIVVIATDPSKITGDEYQVVFSVVEELDDDGNVVSTTELWHLLNTATGDTLLPNQTNQTGDDSYLNAEGITVKVFGAPSDYARDPSGGPAFIEVANEAGPLPEASWDTNGTPFGGNQVWHSLNAGGFADRYFISTTTSGISGMRTNFDALVPFDHELRFTDAGSWGWWAFSSGNVALVPFEIWNIGSATVDDPSDDFQMIPIIMLSALNQDDDVVRALDAGAQDYVTKPYVAEVFVARIRAAVSGKSAYDTIARMNHRLRELRDTAFQFVDNVSHEFRTPLTVIKEF